MKSTTAAATRTVWSAKRSPWSVRIAALLDTFDMLTSDHSLGIAWSVEGAIKYVGSGPGKDFDPRVIAAFPRPYQCQCVTSGFGRFRPSHAHVSQFINLA